MIKTLHLLRHAQSADRQPGQADKVRELTFSGRTHAAEIGRAIKKLNINFDLVICSTALRAKATILIIADLIAYDPALIQWNEEIYEASVMELLTIVGEQDKEINSLLLVGHNPTISSFVSYLAGNKTNELSPGTMATIQFEWSNWRNANQGDGRLIRIIDPQML